MTVVGQAVAWSLADARSALRLSVFPDSFRGDLSATDYGPVSISGGDCRAQDVCQRGRMGLPVSLLNNAAENAASGKATQDQVGCGRS